ncbi:glycerophosphodiester phosphodiesterase [Paenibacillus fonticola]|uniref:glycerophosphodiester phosphodiesterase n=1 Tax=Paenibacillus fonticola TaxID=379896 RepID=UPI0003660723|nr:glycerophosphodiester phosphodiesterase family protein [Paenibacillus fonticola]
MNNLCVAHRGFSSKAPENTMAAIRMAMQNPYVQWVEVDVQLTKDGVPVLIHDYTLNRTTSGRGPVKEKTWEELKKLDAGSWKSKIFKGERLISLDEFLSAICGRLRANIEIKARGDMYPGLEEKVITAIKRRQMERDVVLTSFEPKILARIRELTRGVRTGLIIEGQPKDLLLRLQLLRCSFLSISHRYLTADLAARAARLGITVMAWTIDDARTMKRIAAMHEDILICTNRPDVWQTAMI